MTFSQAPRVALTHDWLNQEGGAEVVLRALHRMLPDAPVYTTIHDTAAVTLDGAWDVRTSWLDKLPRVHARHQAYLPLYPKAWDATHIAGFDAVISNKSAFCHGAQVAGPHLCYCLTPTRFLWQSEEYVRHEVMPPGSRWALQALLPWLQRWDRAAADRVDQFVAISTTVQTRIAETYGRESTVIFPPVAVRRPPVAPPPGDHYVVLSRLVPYKRIDLAVRACALLDRPLVVIGDGRDRARLETLAGPRTRFTGRLPEAAALSWLASARAFLWPGVEDFGIAPVEAMALGRPVIARRAGGVLDTVVEGATGLFFDTEDPEALAAAIVAADGVQWNEGAIAAHAARFAPEVFARELTAALDELRGDERPRVAA